MNRNLSELFRENIKALSQEKSNIPSGLDNFDKRFGGFSLGEFVVLGGRPSMGKTQLLLALCKIVSESNAPTPFFRPSLIYKIL